MKRILVAVFLICSFLTGVAQDASTNCAQTLRLARSTYDQGRLHELERLLGGCLTNGFTKQEKVEALKLLTMSYLYLEEPERADSSMLLLLKTDPFFEYNEDVDPQEFIGLYNTFRTKPIFNVGLKLGVNTTFNNVTANYYVSANGPGKLEYTPQIGFQLGLAFERAIFQNSKMGFLKRLTLAPEILYVPRTYGLNNVQPLLGDNGISISTFEGSVNQNWLDLDVLVQYKLIKDRKGKKSTFNPYVTLGPSVSYLLGSTLQAVHTFKSGNVTSGPDLDVTTTVNTLVYSVVAGAGVKIKVGGIYLTGDIRYQHGFSNITNAEKRTNLESALDYGYVPDDYTINNVSIMIGGSYPVFRPKKKTHRK